LFTERRAAPVVEDNLKISLVLTVAWIERVAVGDEVEIPTYPVFRIVNTERELVAVPATVVVER
jgi:hypothetical protein